MAEICKFEDVKKSLFSLSDDERAMLNKALLLRNSEYDKDPIGTIVNAISDITNVKNDEGFFVFDDEDNRKKDIFSDGSYITWIIRNCQKYGEITSIKYDDNGKFSDEDVAKLNNLFIFAYSIREYAMHNDVEPNVDIINNPYYTVSYNGKLLVITLGLSSYAAGFRLTTKDEYYPDVVNVIGFDEVLTYFQKKFKEKEPQRGKKVEVI